MKILIVGGTGTLGQHVLPLLLQNKEIERIRVLSRDEHKQAHAAQKFNSDRIDWILGDVRDRERVFKATKGCSGVFMFAATKSVDAAEYNPMEAVKTNIEGAHHVVEACIENRVSKAIITSTDKACSPCTLYGATKLVGEKIFIQGNIGSHNSRFAACRYGNVLGSHGSVLEKWERAREEGKSFGMTDPNMTRFWILPHRAAEFVVDCFYRFTGAEVFIPKMKSSTMADLLKAYTLFHGDDRYDFEVIPKRAGEKEHEALISMDEMPFVTEEEDRFIKWPTHRLFPFMEKGKQVELKEPYTSENAPRHPVQDLVSYIRLLELA